MAGEIIPAGTFYSAQSERRKEVEQLQKALVRAGIRIQKQKSGHWKAFVDNCGESCGPGGKKCSGIIEFGGTPSNRYWLNRALGSLLHHGVDL